VGAPSVATAPPILVALYKPALSLHAKHSTVSLTSTLGVSAHAGYVFTLPAATLGRASSLSIAATSI
jgi:hypothetical protein